MADISKIKTLDGTTYDIKDATARGLIPSAATTAPKMDGTAAVGTSAKYAKEDHVHPSDTTKWTIHNYGQGTTDLSVRPLIAFSRANRLAFLPADQIIIETTTDGGTTWVSGGYSDNAKKNLFATRGANIAIPLLNGAKSTNCGVRITITGMKYNVPDGTSETEKYSYWNSNHLISQERYSNLREMWFWISSNHDAIRVQVYRATGAKPNNWIADFDTDFPLNGYSGSDWIRLSGNTFGGGNTQTGNYWNWRIIFWSRMYDGDTAFRSASQQSISGIAGYGDNVWGTPNPLMKEDHLYSWDSDMNATFPAKVTAPSFVGSLTGNASSATNASKVNNHTVDADVPSGAKFTDTKYTANTSKLVTTTVPNITSVGSAPTLGTAISADDITAWTTNTPTTFSVSGEKLIITSGTAASLSYTAKSIPNVTSVGSAPTLGTAITVATGSLASNGSGGTVATGITAS